jgi:anti-anti-sigma regulatory factor
MTLRIESNSDGRTATLRLIGRIEAEHLTELENLVGRHRSQLVLDLSEVTLVDLAFVRFLIAREAEASSLRGSPACVSEWMDGERSRG